MKRVPLRALGLSLGAAMVLESCATKTADSAMSSEARRGNPALSCSDATGRFHLEAQTVDTTILGTPEFYDVVLRAADSQPREVKIKALSVPQTLERGAYADADSHEFEAMSDAVCNYYLVVPHGFLANGQSGMKLYTVCAPENDPFRPETYDMDCHK